MPRWNDQDLLAQVPSLGFTVDSAQLIPAFVEQALASGLFAHAEDTLLTPLDDVKEWIRSDPWRTGELFEQVGDLLLGQERKARKLAEKAGVEFDVVGFELEQMQADSSYESFDAMWSARILSLVIEEASAIQAWSQRNHQSDFTLAVSFQLPDPRRHSKFRREDIAKALTAFDAPALAVASLNAGKSAKLEFSGAFHLDLSPVGEGPQLVRGNGVGYVRVPCSDPRADDETIAHLSLAYPLDAEGFFLQTFDALREHLTLKPQSVED